MAGNAGRARALASARPQIIDYILDFAAAFPDLTTHLLPPMAMTRPIGTFPQPHYDFGLRALKAVLASAGILKRERLQEARSSGDSPDLAVLSDVISEQVILIQSVTETIVPDGCR
ncbi:hypothetical protein BJV77DRAFT_1065840 [Russula vinacea]|nr:hypothetical protein BJV77DRAFT_1065840 [Russula vinacea]